MISPAARPIAPAVLAPSSAVVALPAASPSFKFVAYDALSSDERRVLDASPLDGRSGAALYAHMAAQQPKLLANFLNQTAVMAETRFDNGRNALSYVQRLEGLKINHVYAVVDPALKAEIERVSEAKFRTKARFYGPEDSSMMHGKYDTSFREHRAYTSQQYCFSSLDGFTKVDIDLDEECPLGGSALALVLHWLRCAKHEVLRKWPGTQYGENAEPDDLYRRMSRAPGRIGRGITPRYEL